MSLKLIKTLQEMQTVLQNCLSLELERDYLILLHSEVATVQANCKALELQWRAKLVEDCFPTHEDEGTENLDLGEGWKLQAIFKQGYKVDEATIKDDVQEVCNLGLVYSEAIKDLIKWKPELSTTIYKTLSDEIKDIINNSLTIKPGTPTLKLIAPKAKG